MTYPLVASEDHESRGLAKLLEQFKNKEFLPGVLGVFLRQVQRVETCAWECITYSDINNAFGAGLDVLGRIVGRPRFALGDEDYRQAIKVEIRIKRSRGLAEDLIQITRLAVPEDMTFLYAEPQTHTVLILLVEAATFDVYAVLFNGLRRAKLGGVRLYLTYSVANPENTFTLADWIPGGLQVDLSRGLGSTADPIIGGVLTNILF